MSSYNDYSDRVHDEPETRKVVLWQVKSTDKAILFSTFPEGHKGAKQIWLPKSRMIHISRDPATEGTWPRCTVEIEEWLLEKHDL